MSKRVRIKHRSPSASIAVKGKIGKGTADLFKTVGTIYSPNVVSRGIFSKGRSLMLDKLLFFPISRYFIFKFFNLSFRLGKFFLGGYMSFLNYVHLLIDESNPLSEHLVALNAREGRKSSFNAVDPKSDVHNKKTQKNNGEIMGDQKAKINKKATNK